VILSDLGESTARYTVRYWLDDVNADMSTDSLVRGYIYFALKRAGIPLSMPAQAVFVTQESDERKKSKTLADEADRLRALTQVDLFSTLTDHERERLARSLRPSPFARGEVITRQGAEAHWLYLLTEGTAAVRLAGQDGSQRELARLGPGQYFGEMSLLTGKPRSSSVIALTDVVCYRLDKVAFQDLVSNRQDLADHVATTLAARRTELLSARDGLDTEAAAKRLAQDRSNLLHGIRAFFGLPHAARKQ
jgi:CRP-like cAMP-binding protein